MFFYTKRFAWNEPKIGLKCGWNELKMYIYSFYGHFHRTSGSLYCLETPVSGLFLHEFCSTIMPPPNYHLLFQQSLLSDLENASISELMKCFQGLPWNEYPLKKASFASGFYHNEVLDRIIVWPNIIVNARHVDLTQEKHIFPAPPRKSLFYQIQHQRRWLFRCQSERKVFFLLEDVSKP